MAGAYAQLTQAGDSASVSTALNPSLAGEPKVWAGVGTHYLTVSGDTGAGGSAGWSKAYAQADGSAGVLRGKASSNRAVDYQNNTFYLDESAFGAEIRDVWRLTGQGLTGWLQVDVDADYELFAGLAEGNQATVIFETGLSLPLELDPDGFNAPFFFREAAGLGFDENLGQLVFSRDPNAPPQQRGRIQASFLVEVPLNVDLRFFAYLFGISRGDASVKADNSAYLKATALNGFTLESLNGYSYLGRQGGVEDPGLGEVPEPGSWAMALLGLGGAALLRRRRASLGRSRR